jgi:hypothetical protein
MPFVNHDSIRCLHKMCVASILAVFVSLSALQDIGAQPSTIKTPISPLLDDWKIATAGTKATLDDARKIAEANRPTLPKSDPFTPLAGMSCAERLEKRERVVWEDEAGVMVLVPFGDQGSKLLVVPKVRANFPIDLSEHQLKYVSRIAAATCDAMLVASGKQPAANTPSCTTYINPPAGLGVRQMHVHVEAHTGVSASVDDAFLRRAAAHIRSLVGGAGCF